MKKLFMSVVLAASTMTAYACPNLSGQYECFDDESGSDYIMTVSQTGSGASTVFTVVDFEGTEVLRADGQWRTELQDGIPTQVATKCSGNNVVTNLIQEDANVGRIEATVNVSLNNEGELITQANINFNGSTFTNESICSKL